MRLVLSFKVVANMVFFLVSIILCLILALFHPYASRLGGTGLWLGKALVSPDLAGISPRGIQDALTDGTISRITFASAILPYPVCAIAFFYSWWAPFVVFIFYLVVAAFIAQTNIASKRLDYYINVIQTEMGKRRIKYHLSGDAERVEIMAELEEQVRDVFEIYFNSGVKAPNSTKAQQSPFGDVYHLLQ